MRAEECGYLDVGSMDLSQEDLFRLQAAQFTQLFLQPCVLLIHVQPQTVAHRCGAVQFDHCRHTAPDVMDLALSAAKKRFLDPAHR